MPNNKISGRFTYGFYHKMGITEPICSTIDEFIQKSLYYTSNKPELLKLENRILENNFKLFEEDDSIITWKNQINLLVN